MIPRRLAVEGFLCYRDRQTLSFEGASLWMLGGPNGSGKSTVFDAMTFALFGRHRGGQQKARELIHKACNRLLVEFDFTLDGSLYQIRRTLKRKGSPAATWQVRGWDPGEGAWEEVPDTANEDGFTRWVQQNVGLTYEVFTSSVLLLQGRAETLLTALPARRFEILAAIVGLDRYQRLHERADERRKDLLGRVKLLRSQVEATREVTADEWEEGERRLQSAAAEEQHAREAVQHLQALEAHARHWQKLDQEITRLGAELARAQAVVADAPAILADWARLCELRQVLPPLDQIRTHRERLTRAEDNARRQAAEVETHVRRLRELEHALQEARRKRASLERTIALEEESLREAGHGLRELSALLARVKACEQQRAEIERLKARCARQPRRLDERLEKLRRRHERLTELARLLPSLEQLHAETQELLRARERIQQAASAGEAAAARLGILADQLLSHRQTREQAEAARQEADRRAWEAHTLLGEAELQLKLITELSGAGVCRHCGQALTPGHVHEEQTRRTREWRKAEEAHRSAEAARAAAVAEETKLRGAEARCAEAVEALRQQARDWALRQEQAAQEARQTAQRRQRIVARLPKRIRDRAKAEPVAAATVPSFPGDPLLKRLRARVGQLSAVERALRRARALHDECTQRKIRLKTLTESLAAQSADLPGDLSAPRRRYAELEAKDRAARDALRLARAHRDEVHGQLEGLERRRDPLADGLAVAQRRLAEENTVLALSREALDQLRHALSPQWRALADREPLEPSLQAWRQEEQRLVAAGAEDRVHRLRDAQTLQDSLRSQRQRLEAEAAQLPGEARRDPAEVEAELHEARRRQAALAEDLRQAREHQAMLGLLREQRSSVEAQLLAAEREHRLREKLAQLLGRDRLQLHLVRRAERGIVEYANAVLGRLTGGGLYLRLIADQKAEAGNDKALQLEAIHEAAGPDPIRVEFLSGSQRFRVAVSLALGIGQYASRRQRPVESVIIDEGFGCLDKDNRQVMIRELQNLQGQLRCILVVSHQEEFAEAFADAYHFELSDGTARVSRRLEG